jgi:hypothetical protein
MRLRVVSIEGPCEDHHGKAHVRIEAQAPARLRGVQARIDYLRSRSADKTANVAADKLYAMVTEPEDEVKELVWFREWKRAGLIALRKA